MRPTRVNFLENVNISHGVQYRWSRWSRLVAEGLMKDDIKTDTMKITKDQMVKKVLQERQYWVFRFTVNGGEPTQFIGPFKDSVNILAKVIHQSLTDNAEQSFKLEGYHGEYASEFLLSNPPGEDNSQNHIEGELRP
jgi:hypothetical protein